jgi:hypothetical protein
MKICESGVLFDDVSDGLLPFYDFLSHLIKFFASSSIVLQFSLGFALVFAGFMFFFSANGTAIFCLILMALESLGSESYFSL